MAGASAARPASVTDASQQLFDAIGAFLAAQRLSPDPRHYAFVHRILTNPDSVVARSVAALTADGVRLSARDIETLGGEIGEHSVPAPSTDRAAVDGLVAQTQMQVEGFTDMVATMRAEAAGFGRDLAASADAIRAADTAPEVGEVVRLTAAMLDRVHQSEARLAAATDEANELREKLEEARGDARRDPLTDLPNRRAFEEAFDARMTPDASLCIAVIDIDHFKAVNDAFGHAVGDRVLKSIADVLGTACGDHLVARYGGEEFAVLFTGIDCGAAHAILETARAKVAAKRYRLRETDAPIGSVTFSAGITAVEPGETLGTALGRADRLLYAAKDAGRNNLRAA